MDTAVCPVPASNPLTPKPARFVHPATRPETRKGENGEFSDFYRYTKNLHNSPRPLQTPAQESGGFYTPTPGQNRRDHNATSHR